MLGRAELFHCRPMFRAFTTIERRLGALSGLTSRLVVESCKPLAIWLGLSGASLHQSHTTAGVPRLARRSLPACPTKLPGA
jgi:hypothetical protein